MTSTVRDSDPTGPVFGPRLREDDGHFSMGT
jgi:hypothetical protein